MAFKDLEERYNETIDNVYTEYYTGTKKTGETVQSFNNLEEKYSINADSLYEKARLKFDGGKESDGINDDPLITRRVGDGYWGFGESRSLPVRSAALDVQRLTKFYVSQRGLLAYGKQQLLQTGNTFEFTRLLNPTFALGNAVPFLHVRRHLTPKLSLDSITSLVGRTDASTAPVREWGQMQVGSYEKLKNYSQPKFITALGLNSDSAGGQNNNDSVSLGAKFLNKLKSELQAISPFNATRNVGEKFGYDEEGRKKSRPELAEGSIVSIVDSAIAKYQTGVDKLFEEETDGNITSQPFLKYFTAPDVGVITSRDKIRDGANAQSLSKDEEDNRKRLRYIKDPLNEDLQDSREDILSRYELLKNVPEADGSPRNDAIIVSFAMGNSGHVQFRAFIRDLNQTASPEYKTYQYVGRIEKFVYYVTVEREISFKLDLLAFSKDELNNVWTRINYLTGLVFPYGVNKGILQPNITRLTIGNIYKNQPGYITSLNTTFNEISESWDIDEQVPIGATMNMSFKLIEKTTMDADKAFYGINERGTPEVIIGEPELPLGFTPEASNPNIQIPPPPRR